MIDLKRKTLMKYIIPAILSNSCIFLFTIIDGVFVGNGIGSDALGAVNIAMPIVINDKEGANQAFLHSLTANIFLPQ